MQLKTVLLSLLALKTPGLKMRILPVLGILAFPLVLSVRSRAAPLAGPFTNPGNGHRYYLLNPDTWTNSEAQANALGGHLATVRSQAENDWILNTFSPIVGNSGPNIWIGFYDPVTGDGTGGQHAADFRWTSGEPVTYTHWGQGEPNNSVAFGGEYYAILEVVPFNVLVPGDWNDQSNTSSNSSDYGVVEIVPEPTTLALMALALVSARRLMTKQSRKNDAD
jgi:hypothetical protein